MRYITVMGGARARVAGRCLPTKHYLPGDVVGSKKEQESGHGKCPKVERSNDGSFCIQDGTESNRFERTSVMAGASVG
jgi:hypothetical protein